jgi:hypothetical protein
MSLDFFDVANDRFDFFFPRIVGCKDTLGVPPEFLVDLVSWKDFT